MEILISTITTILISSGFVSILVKVSIGNRLDRSLKKYEHELSHQKDILSMELSLQSQQIKERSINYASKSIAALEAVHKAITNTRFDRTGIRVVQNSLSPSKPVDEEKINSEYLSMFEKIFGSLHLFFMSLVETIDVIEEKSIYLDKDIEAKATRCIGVMLRFYRIRLDQMGEEACKVKMLMNEGRLSHENRNFDFDRFMKRLNEDRKSVVDPLISDIKDGIRILLTPTDTECINRNRASPTDIK